MKVGFFGNTNNFPFILARAFRCLGHEVVFIVNRAERLHRPEFRYDDITIPYPEWIHDIPLRSEVDICLPSRNLTKALNLLKQCDIVVLNELGPALQTRIGRPAMALLTGSDLGCLADPEYADIASSTVTGRPLWLKRTISRRLWKRLISLQRAGIAESRLVFHYWRGIVPANDALLDGLGVGDDRRTFRYISDVMQLPFCPPPNNRPLRTFCATRLSWKRPAPVGTTELDLKGSDVMIRGLGLFFRKHRYPLDIQLVRKGLHVNETEALVSEEGLSKLVTWSNELSQHDCWKRYREADLVFEQFGNSMLGMAAIDAMALGRPVIANGRPEFLVAGAGRKSPVCQAASPGEVCAQMERLAFDPSERENVGLASRNFVAENYSSDAAARTILERVVSR